MEGGAVLSYASSSDGSGQLYAVLDSLDLLSLVITKVMDMNTHRDCRRATDTVRVLFSSPGRNVIMAMVGSAGHSD